MGQTINNKHQKVFSASHAKFKKIEKFRVTNKKKMFNLYFDSHFVSCLYYGKFRGCFGFFHLNLLAINFYFWSTKLTEINNIIVNILNGNSKYIKNDGHLVFKGQKKVISFQRH